MPDNKKKAKNPIQEWAESNQAVFSFVQGLADVPPSDNTTNISASTSPSNTGLNTETPKASTPVEIRSPMEIYEDELSEYGLTLDDAAKIVDKLISSNEYTEAVQITKRLRVVFRTRTPGQLETMYRVINDDQPTVQGMAVNTVAKYNLAFSLVAYNDTKLNPNTTEGLRQSIDFIDRLPGPLYTVLVSKLAQFDEKLQLVMRDEAIVNF